MAEKKAIENDQETKTLAGDEKAELSEKDLEKVSGAAPGKADLSIRHR
jgi:hypothetical protein